MRPIRTVGDLSNYPDEPARLAWVATLKPDDEVEVPYSLLVEDIARLKVLSNNGAFVRLLRVGSEDEPRNWLQACAVSGITLPYGFKLVPPGTTVPYPERDAWIPVTGLLLALVETLQSAQTMFVKETLMAEEMHAPLPPVYSDRIKELFFTAYANNATAAGLQVDQSTLDGLLEARLTEEMEVTPFADLPSQFCFLPGYGIKRADTWRRAAPRLPRSDAQDRGGASNEARVVLRTADGCEGTEVVELLKSGSVKHQPMSWDREPELQTVSAEIRVGNDCLPLTGDDRRDIDNHGTDENFWKPLLRGDRSLGEVWQQFLESELESVSPARPRPR